MPVTSVRPIVERIADKLFQRLQQLTAGYTTTCAVSEVIRPTARGDFTPKNLQIVLTQGEIVRSEDLDCPGNPPAIAWTQTFNIRCHVNPSEKDTTSASEYINTMLADVIKVVCDASLWHTFGGLAIDANWQTPVMIEPNGSFIGANQPLAVTFRVDETNPYNVRA